MTEAVFFYLFSGVMLTAALLVVFHRQPVYSVLALLVTMFCLAALFVMLGAYVVAALQILLYAGAVLVLFLFVVMLLNLEPDAMARIRPWRRTGLSIVVALLFCGQFLGLLNRTRAPLAISGDAGPLGSVEELGRLLFTTYLLPFELTSFLILAAIIGAVTLARGMWKRE